jgi:hypothetical protein
MNPFIYPATCSVCGSDGVTADPMAGWLSETVHRDPRVCRANIKVRERARQCEQEHLREQLTPKFTECESGEGI